MRRSLLWLFIIFPGTAQFAHAQTGVVTGTISDGGIPVAQVNVTNEHQPWGTVTDSLVFLRSNTSPRALTRSKQAISTTSPFPKNLQPQPARLFN